MDKRPSIMIKTDKFGFTNNDLIFVSSHIGWMYPNVMKRVIEQLRQLMKQIQTQAKNKAKLTYYASLSHPDETDRFIVTEMLYNVDENNHRTMMSIEPVEERTTEFVDNRAVLKTIRKVQTLLTNPELSPADVRLVGSGFIPHRVILKALNEFLNAVSRQIVIKEYSFSLNPDDDPHIYLHIQHKFTQSHQIRIRFDFFVRQKVEQPTQPCVEETSSE